MRHFRWKDFINILNCLLNLWIIFPILGELTVVRFLYLFYLKYCFFPWRWMGLHVCEYVYMYSCMQICTYPFHSASCEKKQKQNPNARTTLEFPALQTLFCTHDLRWSKSKTLPQQETNWASIHKIYPIQHQFLHCWHIVQVLPWVPRNMTVIRQSTMKLCKSKISFLSSWVEECVCKQCQTHRVLSK